MDSFVFNTFKERLINGGLPLDTVRKWVAYPVKKNFSDIFGDKIESLRSPIDFVLYNRVHGNSGYSDTSNYLDDYLSTIFVQKYTYKVMEETDMPMEPEFVTLASWELFKNNIVANEPDIAYEHLENKFFKKDGEFYRESGLFDDTGNPIPRGFYYVRTVEELLWCANKVNAEYGYDNTINIVLGDNIGTNDTENKKEIYFCIGSKPNRQFDGILYGNGFKFMNIKLVCNGDVNGIVGYLGYNGIISAVTVAKEIDIVCNKKINLSHLIYDGSDIGAGFLCGKNNARNTGCGINNVIVDNVKFNFNGFYPQIYSTQNKDDGFLDTYDYNPEKNMYYPDFYCYNSPGNIIPYVGYFNEGVFATYSGWFGDTQYGYWNTMTEYGINPGLNVGELYKDSPMEWFYWAGPNIENYGFAFPFTREKNRVNVLWYDGKIVSRAADVVGALKGQACNNGLLQMDIYSESFLAAQEYNRIKYAQYFNRSIKLSQQNRAAYYVSPIVGINNGNISVVSANCSAVTSGTFVGFMGGLAGKQAKGSIYDIQVNFTSQDSKNDNSVENDTLYYKRDYFLQSASTQENNEFNYNFPQRSIKNISSLFGSCVVGGVNNLVVDSTSSYFRNNNCIVREDGNIEYDDYYFANRFGSFAAVVEYNSSNIEDIWVDQETVNNPELKSIRVSNSCFCYVEDDPESVGVKELLSPYKSTNVSSVAGSENNMFGVAASLIAEIKPYYLSLPTIISTPFINRIEENQTSASRVGIFMVDQLFAQPLTDPNFWSINTEIDLPGVSNYPSNDTMLSYKSNGFAGGVVDRLNNPVSENFDIDIRKIGNKLIRWNNCKVIDNFNTGINAFVDIKVPGYAYIENSHYLHDGNVYEIDGGTIPGNSSVCNSTGDIHDYVANKVLNNYAYFGSDIYIKPNILTGEGINEFVTGDYKIRVTLTNPMYDWSTVKGTDYTKFNTVYYGTGGGKNYFVGNCVKEIYIEINSDALKYQPFTDVAITQEQIEKYYSLSAYCDRERCFGDKNYDRVITPIEYDGHNFVSFADKIYTDFSQAELYGTTSGWVFGVDNSDDETFIENIRHYLFFMVPFDVMPYMIDPISYPGNKLEFPPYSPFYGIYTVTTGSNSHNAKYDRQAVPNINNVPISGWPLTVSPMIAANTELVPGIEYYRGIDDDTGEDVYEWENPPELTAQKVYAYKWISADNNGTIEFRFDDGTPDGTLIPPPATQRSCIYNGLTKQDLIDRGYPDPPDVPGNPVAGVLASREYYINASDGKKYPCYSAAGKAYEDRNDCMIDVAANYMLYQLSESAAIQSGFNVTAYNWQDPLYLYPGVDSRTVVDVQYDYTIRGLNYTSAVSRNYMPENLTTYPGWYNQKLSGSFINNLMGSDGNYPPGIGLSMASTAQFDDPGLTMKINDARVEISGNSDARTGESSATDYYKYTYEKEYVAGSMDPVSIDVKFAYANGLAGFWFQQRNGNGEIASGTIEYNDNVKYYPNVFNIGTTLNQTSILNKCLKNDTRKYTVSGFSADDFDGLYIVDETDTEDQVPVMYIDVGLGECEQGTSWTYECKTNVSGDISAYAPSSISGLLLEVNSDV